MTDDENVTGVPGTPEPAEHAPNRNLALELARVTEAAAMAAARWVGLNCAAKMPVLRSSQRCSGHEGHETPANTPVRRSRNQQHLK